MKVVTPTQHDRNAELAADVIWWLMGYLDACDANDSRRLSLHSGHIDALAALRHQYQVANGQVNVEDVPF